MLPPHRSLRRRCDPQLKTIINSVHRILVVFWLIFAFFVRYELFFVTLVFKVFIRCDTLPKTVVAWIVVMTVSLFLFQVRTTEKVGRELDHGVEGVEEDNDY